MRRLLQAAPFHLWVLIPFLLSACSGLGKPDMKGEINLSSQLFGTESYYLFGFSYEKGELSKYPFTDETIPDIINEGFQVIEGSSARALPGFNTPGGINGFALAGSFESQEEARTFFDSYDQVEDGLQFVVLSDSVKEHQVWVQQTSIGNYAKLLVKEVSSFPVESGRPYSEVVLDYVYQSDGSTAFPE